MSSTDVRYFARIVPVLSCGAVRLKALPIATNNNTNITMQTFEYVYSGAAWCLPIAPVVFHRSAASGVTD
jgi:hypothetical protein